MPTYQQVGHKEANPLGMNRGTMVMITSMFIILTMVVMVSMVSRHRGTQGMHKGTSPSELWHAGMRGARSAWPKRKTREKCPN